ncbi:carbohydrate sulfotransferase 3 [Lingula anatina]|uniref:Carbohydrate sulfotransferase 3 n=1 Tax=Lingula anatina TaxID=7574 RepID=A0A1S3K826_LINAN|nr:carbohydrate sulfotransferase 3 [Lingula anatina]|eukprot:XP_013418647.1 carbohydrate sulfotransferase 3 [Lingula anatina]
MEKRKLGWVILICGVVSFEIAVLLQSYRQEEEQLPKMAIAFQDTDLISHQRNSSFMSRYSPTDGVIILTYVRSGSSLVGQLFNQNPNAVYFYEPLRWIKESLEQPSIYTYSNNTQRKISGTHSQREKDFIYADVIKKLITCEVHDVPSTVTLLKKYNVYNLLTLNQQKALKDYENCAYIRVRGKQPNCMTKMKNVCDNSTLKVMKLVRLSMNAVEPILTQLPNVKVIHLLRDPRASLLSKKKAALFKCNLDCEVDQRCNKQLLPDITHGKVLEAKYPGRIMQIKYEDLAAKPLYWSTKIYSFIGQKLPPVVEHWIHRATSSSEENGTYGTKRQNSSKTAHKWETEIGFEMAEKVDVVCKTVLDLLGYEPYLDIYNKNKRSNV